MPLPIFKPRVHLREENDSKNQASERARLDHLLRQSFQHRRYRCFFDCQNVSPEISLKISTRYRLIPSFILVEVLEHRNKHRI